MLWISIPSGGQDAKSSYPPPHPSPSKRLLPVLYPRNASSPSCTLAMPPPLSQTVWTSNIQGLRSNLTDLSIQAAAEPIKRRPLSPSKSALCLPTYGSCLSLNAELQARKQHEPFLSLWYDSTGVLNRRSPRLSGYSYHYTINSGNVLGIHVKE